MVVNVLLSLLPRIVIVFFGLVFLFFGIRAVKEKKGYGSLNSMNLSSKTPFKMKVPIYTGFRATAVGIIFVIIGLGLIGMAVFGTFGTPQ